MGFAPLTDFSDRDAGHARAQGQTKEAMQACAAADHAGAATRGSAAASVFGGTVSMVVRNIALASPSAAPNSASFLPTRCGRRWRDTKPATASARSLMASLR